MVAIPSGTPIPTPSAVGRVAERSSVWADAVRSVDLLAGEGEGALVDTADFVDTLAGEDARTVVAFEKGPSDNVVDARLLRTAVGANGEDVTGGNPKIEPVVELTKLASPSMLV